MFIKISTDTYCISKSKRGLDKGLLFQIYESMDMDLLFQIHKGVGPNFGTSLTKFNEFGSELKGFNLNPTH